MRFRSAGGFSLIEIMITFALLAVVVVTGTMFMRYISSNYFFSMSQYQLTDQATFTARQIATELRQAEQAMNGAYALEVLNDNEIVFYADANNDGGVERRRYYLDGSTLRRDVD
jgi:type II secretory pathway component PulJ